MRNYSIYTLAMVLVAFVALILQVFHVWDAGNTPEFVLILAILNEVIDARRDRG